MKMLEKFRDFFFYPDEPAPAEPGKMKVYVEVDASSYQSMDTAIQEVQRMQKEHSVDCTLFLRR